MHQAIADERTSVILSLVRDTKQVEGNMSTTITNDWTEADIEAGFRIGVEGVLFGKEAAEFLGCSTDTLLRIVRDGHIRTTKVSMTTAYCKRSMLRYLASNEA